MKVNTDKMWSVSNGVAAYSMYGLTLQTYSYKAFEK